MDVNWQHNNPPNPADAAIGPMGYDNHLYYNFGVSVRLSTGLLMLTVVLQGVADPNEDAYLTSICNLQRVQNDAAVGDSPLWFGEWGLPTQFNASSCVAHSLVFGAKDVMDTHSAASAGLTKMSFMVDQKYAVALSQPHNTTTNQRNRVVLWLSRS